jgi:hypothetical protein
MGCFGEDDWRRPQVFFGVHVGYCLDQSESPAERKEVWVGWVERNPGRVGANIHSEMHFVPDHLLYMVPLNIVYQIPMTTVYSPGIAVPVHSPPTLDIDMEQIRSVIVDALM